MAELNVEICSHFFKVTQITPRGRAAVETFAKKVVQWGVERVPTPGGPARYAYRPLRVFAAATADRTEYRFHIHQLKDFRAHLQEHRLVDELVAFTDRARFEPTPVGLQIQPHWEDRDYQIPVIEYLIAPPPPVQKLVQLQTGKGKSYCAMRAFVTLGFRVLIVVRPMYLEKWVEDIMRTMMVEVKDLMVVQGSTHLQALLQLAAAGELNAKIVLMSNKTYQNWIKLYEEFGEQTLDQGYVCTPDQLCQTLGVGVRAIDEVHQDFHLNYKIDLYTHVPHSLSLSATLLADDDFLNKMYEIAYPAIERYQGPAYDKYIAARAVIWKLRYPNKVRTKEYGSKTYSHHAFEKSLLKYPEMLQNYFNLVRLVVQHGFFRNDYREGDRCLLYFASIDMCTRAVAFLRQCFPGTDIRRYVEEDPYENLMEAEISVSTLQSAGTAVDIDKLTTVILTTAVSSSQSNIQGFGRLRKLKDDRTPEFYYFACEDIPKHLEYHEKKRVLLRDRALSYKSMPAPGMV